MTQAKKKESTDNSTVITLMVCITIIFCTAIIKGVAQGDHFSVSVHVPRECVFGYNHGHDEQQVKGECQGVFQAVVREANND